MTTSLKEALMKAGVDLSPEEVLEEHERREAKHRSKEVLERPSVEFTLNNVRTEEEHRKKYQSNPTADLVEIPNGLTKEGLESLLNHYIPARENEEVLVWCEDTKQTWYAHTKLCLDQNFIYREDLELCQFSGIEKAWSFYEDRGAICNPGVDVRKSCYLLDNPANESYEVYYDSNYPKLKYGKATPNGMFVHKYDNRFQRDMAIMELDTLYTECSKKRAAEYTKKELKPNEAIIISDGGFMDGVCTSAYYYIDAVSLVKMSQGVIPTEPKQAVLISEIVGATSALQMCRLKEKKKITYYYDNTSILNCLRNRNTEYIQEVVEYKQMLSDMDAAGYEITFVELHPKRGENRDETNKALMFFHNYCDKECQEMTTLFRRDYRSIAISDNASGKTFGQVKGEFRPKSKPRQGGEKSGVQNNSRNGNNRYGRQF